MEAVSSFILIYCSRYHDSSFLGTKSLLFWPYFYVLISLFKTLRAKTTTQINKRDIQQ